MEVNRKTHTIHLSLILLPPYAGPKGSEILAKTKHFW